MANIGTIVGGGFRVMKERPLAVAVWAAVHVVISLASQLYVRSTMGAAVADPELIRSGAVSPFSMMGSMIPLWLLSALIMAVLTCAVYRVVLRPAESSFASLRLGMDELRFLGIALVLIVAMIIVGVIAVLLLGVVVGGIAAATGGGSASVIVAIALWLVCFCGGIFVWVRLSLIFPLSFARRSIEVDGAWSLTKGNFWTLFVAYFIVWVICVILTIVLVGSTMAPYFAMMSQGFRNPEAMQHISEQIQQQQQDMSLATLILMAVLGAIVSTVTTVLGAGASATATRELLLDSGEVPEGEAESTAAIFE